MVGCGISTCDVIDVDGANWMEASMLVCNYYPAGNIQGKLQKCYWCVLRIGLLQKHPLMLSNCYRPTGYKMPPYNNATLQVGRFTKREIGAPNAPTAIDATINFVPRQQVSNFLNCWERALYQSLETRQA